MIASARLGIPCSVKKARRLRAPFAHGQVDGNDPSKLGDLYEDAEIVRSAVGDVEGLVVVCAHSYGGAPVTEVLVGMRKVGRLVYLCAWQLDVGESLLCARQVVPPPWWDVHVV